MNEEIVNATGANSSAAVPVILNMGLSSISGMDPMVFAILIVAALFFGLALALFSLTWLRWFTHYLEQFGKSFVYAAKGAGLTVCVGAIYFTLIQVGGALSSIPPIYYLYAILGYIGLVIVGYVGTKVYVKLEGQLKRLDKEKA